jgi:hypothetical protein
MTKGDVQIEVICKLTNDPKAQVIAVINVMRKLMPRFANAVLDEKLTDKEANKLRKQLMDDKDLISWYKDGLRYRHLLKQL